MCLHSRNPDEINTSAVWAITFYPRGSCNKKASLSSLRYDLICHQVYKRLLHSESQTAVPHLQWAWRQRKETEQLGLWAASGPAWGVGVGQAVPDGRGQKHSQWYPKCSSTLGLEYLGSTPWNNYLLSLCLCDFSGQHGGLYWEGQGLASSFKVACAVIWRAVVLSVLDFVTSERSVHTNLTLPFLSSASFPRIHFSSVWLLLAALLPDSPRRLSGGLNRVNRASGSEQWMTV